MLGKLVAGFPWGVLLVTDEGSMEPVPEWAADEEQVSHGESVAVLRVMHEQEGDVMVQCGTTLTPAPGSVVFQGSSKLESGILKVSDALGEAVLAIPTAAGSTVVVIHTDAATEPTRFDVVVAAALCVVMLIAGETQGITALSAPLLV